jgi:hypothetical protein
MQDVLVVGKVRLLAAANPTIEAPPRIWSYYLVQVLMSTSAQSHCGAAKSERIVCRHVGDSEAKPFG